MDIDVFSSVHRGEWNRLDELCGKRRLDGAEADELVRLYQTVATHLSTVRSTAPDPSLISDLSLLLSRARAKIGGAHDPAWRTVLRFLGVTLPAAFYRIRWWTVAVTIICVAIALVVGFRVATNPDALAAMGTPSERERYVNDMFTAYYSQKSSFGAMVWTNNAWIAAQCVGLGITGVWPALVLYSNAVQVGSVGGMMGHYGALDVFLKSILPHGLLELTSIFAAGAAGLKTFWAVIAPGHRSRGRALAEEGRALITVAIGLALALSVAGLIESKVTGLKASWMPWWLKIAIGALALAGFWVYTIVLGRRAVRAGETGDMNARERGDVQPVAG